MASAVGFVAWLTLFAEPMAAYSDQFVDAPGSVRHCPTGIIRSIDPGIQNGLFSTFHRIQRNATPI
jgi:hypothetical protein